MTTRNHSGDKLAGIREALAGAGADALLVTEPANVRYLTSFSSPEDGAVLVLPDRAVLFTDARYTAQAAQESRLPVEIVSNADEAIAKLVADIRLAVESEHVTVKRFRNLARLTGKEPLAIEGVLAAMRVIKTPQEIDLLREAARITDVAYAAALGTLKAGVSEVEVALELERVMRQEGADGSGFDIIVASGERGAMPHGVASAKKIAEGELVTLDFGAAYRGYHADMTRTVAVGAIGAEQRRMFDAVLEAQKAAIAAVAPGKKGSEVDQVARSILDRHGLGEAFSHSLGHGTGLAIHEDPRLSQRSDDVLEPGMIVTIEPGVYVPGFTGLRIEDLVVVTENGHEVLSHSPKEFQQL
ncbi:MAG TPA: Xaa-Pro peptidase family protein [Trueperaceae bacterium]|nr:Xaa-Pro peptidase family protein [Trueperaceae bacterium]